MPNHQHLNETVFHTHGIDYVHSDTHGGTQTPQDNNGTAVALVNPDSAVSVASVLDQTLLAQSLDFQPSDGLLRPFGRPDAVTQTYASPPKTPPKFAA